MSLVVFENVFSIEHDEVNNKRIKRISRPFV